MREIQKRKDMKWIIYTDSMISMLVIENSKENHPILNQIYDIPAGFITREKRSLYIKSLHT